MKLIVAICFVLAVVAAAPAPAPAPAPEAKYVYNPQNVQLLRYDVDNIGTGSYSYGYEQSDGTKQEQRGEIVNEGREDESLEVTGIFSWVGPDGVTYIVRYTAGREGYKPEIEEGPGGALSPAVLASLAG